MAKNNRSDEPAEQYVTGEQHAKMATASSHGPRKSVTVSSQTALIVLGIAVLCGLSFAAGMGYQKGHTKKVATATSATEQGSFRMSGGFGRRAGGLGQVTAVSSTSITISNQRTGADSTYTINLSTAISDNGQTVAASDIQAGDTVLVMTSGSGSTTATRILVNPSFGGSSGGPPASTDAQTQTD
ncbi:MAG TPA: hypothetical protein VLG27_03260 [Candidatus Saccharimonadia bacterium]|nr:hypothetical protein [Candidatus Saccharimonadia bacterium]